MLKFRPTIAFRDKIAEARRIFGTDGNSATAIVRRALRYHKTHNFDYKPVRCKGESSPVSWRIETDLTPKELQGLVIEYINIQIEKTASRIQKPLDLDSCKEYIIENVKE